jgi:hypothetical protein
MGAPTMASRRYKPLEVRAKALTQRLQEIRSRRDELLRGQAVDAHDVDMARRRAANSALMSAAAHDRLSERYEAASVTDPEHAEDHRRAANAHRSASDADLRKAFDEL